MTTNPQKTTTELIDRYFAAAPMADAETYFALFASDATVEDEGVTHYGIAEIRAWRAAVPVVSYRVLDVRAEAGEHAARVAVSGEFPGSPVTLVFRLAFGDDGLIRSLTIRI